MKTFSRIIAITCLFIFSASNLFAQGGLYQKVIGGTGNEENAYCIHTEGGGFLIAGTTNSGGAGGRDIFVMRTDVDMNIVWSKTFGGPLDDVLFDRQPTQSMGQIATPIGGAAGGGFFILGHTFSFGQGSSDLYLIRIDNNGNLLWSKTYGDALTERGISVKQLSNGDLLLLGDVETGLFGGKDIHIVRTDVNGNTLWNKRIGLSGHDQIFGTQITSDGGFIFAGATTSSGAGNFDAVLYKADASGNIQWSKTYGGTNNDSYQSIVELSGGGFVVTGYTQSFGAGTHDYILTRTDALGNILWTKTYGGGNTDIADHLIQTRDGGYAFVGPSMSFGAGDFDAMLIKTDANGNVQFAMAYGGVNAEIARSLDETDDDGFHICGFTQSFGAGGWDVYSIRTNAAGQSGCNETSVNPAVTNASLTTQNFNPSVTTGGIEGIVSTQVGNISFQLQTLCASQVALLDGVDSLPPVHPDSIVAYDRYGRGFSLKQITPPSTQANPCVAGFFRLDFIDPPNTGFNDNTLGPQRRAVACQVFTDLSQLLIPALDPYTNTATIPLVNIQLSSPSTMPPGALGMASAFYIDPNISSFSGGLVHGEVWKTINGGINSYFGFDGCAYYHGYVQINFNNILNWHYNLATPPSPTDFDMYTVVLHEAIHSLGFVSAIGASGNSLLAGQYYTGYDSYLQTTSGVPLIVNPGNCYTSSFNSTPSALTTVCGVRFQGGTPHHVFTPAAFQQGSSLSHFDPTCISGLNNLVMQAGLATGLMRRRPLQEEVDAFCDIGYNTTNTYGTTTSGLGIYFNTYNQCTNRRIAGVNDIHPFANSLPYETNQGQPITINDVLQNDEDNGGIPVQFDCLSIVSGGGTLSNTFGTTFIYTPTATFVGIATLRYIPVSATGRRGNITIVQINVMPWTCPITSCDLVCNGDFEIITDKFAAPLGNFVLNPSCQNSPDLFFNNTMVINGSTTNGFGCATVNNPFPHDFPLKNKYIGLQGFLTGYREAMFIKLNSPMLQNSTYNFSFWAAAASSTCFTTMQIVGSFDRPCLPPGTTDLTTPSSCGTYTFTPVAINSVSINSTNWVQYNFTYTVPPGSDINYVIFAPYFPTFFSYTYLDDPEIRLNLTVNAGSNVTIPCNGSTNLNATVNTTFPVTYAWSPSTNLSCTTCPNPVANPTVTTTYTVTVTDANGCTTASSTVTVTVLPCNCVGNTTVNATTYNGGNTVLTDPTSLAINGNLTLINNAVVSINFSPNVLMATGVTITVNPGCTLNIFTSHLTACLDMWDGIILNGFGAVCNVNNSQIEDATTAITSIGGGKYDLFSSRFNRNIIAVDVQAYNAGAHPGIVRRCWFTSWTTPFSGVPAFIFKAPYAGFRADKGFKIDNVFSGTLGIEVGSAPFVASSVNRFDYLDFGVYSTNSNVTIRNNRFNRIDFSPCTGNCFIGYPVYATGVPGSPKKLIVGSTTSNQNNIFQNSWRNVFASINLDVDVIGNNFSTVGLSGVFVSDCGQRIINIKNNVIGVFNQEGIHCKFNPGSFITISNNYVASSADGEAFIVDEASTTVITVIIGPGNRTQLVPVGMHLVNVRRPRIINNGAATGNNQIRFRPGVNSGFGYGIWMQNCPDATVQNNYIRGDASTYSSNTQMFGIDVASSTNQSIRENKIWFAGNCIRAFGAMNTTRLFCNVIGGTSQTNLINGSYMNGIILENIPFGGIGPFGTSTSPSDNTWSTPLAGGFHTLMTNTTNGANMFGPSPWWWVRNFPLFFVPTLNGQIGGVALGPPGLNTTALGSSVCFIDPCIICPPCCRQAQIGSIVKDSLPFSNLSSGDKWMARFFAFNALKDNPSWLNMSHPDDPLYQQFFNTYQLNNIGKFTEVNTRIEMGTPNDLAIAMSVNSSVFDSCIIENNQKTVNEIYLNTIAAGIDTFTTQQTQTLQNIASQDPLQGGNAVYGAMVLLDLHAHRGLPQNVRLSNSSYEGNSSYEEKALIYPNPAKNEATLDYSVEEGQKGILEIYSVLGQKIASYELKPNETLHFNISSFETGVYLYNVTVNDAVIYSDRLVIIK